MKKLLLILMLISNSFGWCSMSQCRNDTTFSTEENDGKVILSVKIINDSPWVFLYVTEMSVHNWATPYVLPDTAYTQTGYMFDAKNIHFERQLGIMKKDTVLKHIEWK